MKKKIIEYKNVDVFYSKNKNILSDVNFQINEGDFVTIFGKNGSGKTTLVKALHGIVKYKGEILLNGSPTIKMNKKDIAKKVAYISQFDNSLEGVKAIDYLLMARFPHNPFIKLNKSDDLKLIQKLLNRFHSSHLQNKYMDELSNGQQQIVNIIAGIAQETDVFLVDEPTNHLDPKVVLQVFDILADLKKEGKTIILISHSLNDALKLADKLFLISDGKLKIQGNVNKVLTKKNIDSLFDVDSKVLGKEIKEIKLKK